MGAPKHTRTDASALSRGLPVPRTDDPGLEDLIAQEVAIVRWHRAVALHRTSPAHIGELPPALPSVGQARDRGADDTARSGQGVLDTAALADPA